MAQVKGKNLTPQEPKRVRVRLKSASDVAKFQARCIRAALSGQGGTLYFNLVNMSSQLLKSLEVAELEKRIEKLEEKPAK
jgi:hypothetical protein